MQSLSIDARHIEHSAIPDPSQQDTIHDWTYCRLAQHVAPSACDDMNAVYVAWLEHGDAGANAAIGQCIEKEREWDERLCATLEPLAEVMW